MVPEDRWYRESAKEDQRHNVDRRIFPCSNGTHSKLTLTVRELSDRLILRTSIVVQGHLVELNLRSVLYGAMGLIDADPCEHPASSDLSSAWHGIVVMTNIEAPRTEKARISIVQTAGDPTAQLLACQADAFNSAALMQRRCCLNCAVAQAEEKRTFQIIVA